MIGLTNIAQIKRERVREPIGPTAKLLYRHQKTMRTPALLEKNTASAAAGVSAVRHAHYTCSIKNISKTYAPRFSALKLGYNVLGKLHVQVRGMFAGSNLLSRRTHNRNIR